MRKFSLILLAIAMLWGVSAIHISSATMAKPNTTDLQRAVRAKNIYKHLTTFQRFAEQSGGRRAAGTKGYDLSAQYVYTMLEEADYKVSFQDFPFLYYEELREEGQQISPTQRNLDVEVINYSSSTPKSGLEGFVVVVPESNATGCTPQEFEGQNFQGKIALIKRGACTFWEKAKNAENVGAIAAIIYNNVSNPDARFDGNLVNPANVKIPVVGVTRRLGEALTTETAGGTQPVKVFLNIETLLEERTTRNVIAETEEGSSDQVIVVGAHLDSVFAGPGLNDNGSGSATILEIALQMEELDIEPKHKVRFAFWGAEELGLIGSTYYVNQLSSAEIDKIALNLNFDMIASPNYVRFVYDGDNSAFPPGSGSAPGPKGSDIIEKVFLDFFKAQGLASAETPFSGRSDYRAFINVGIPAGGLFTGAEGVKTQDQAALYGGTAGVAYDKCYHQACDGLMNINITGLEEMSDAAAHAVQTFAMHSLLSTVGSREPVDLSMLDDVHEHNEHEGDPGHNHCSDHIVR